MLCKLFADHVASSRVKPRRCQENRTEIDELMYVLLPIYGVNQNHFIVDRCIIIIFKPELASDWLILSTVKKKSY